MIGDIGRGENIEYGGGERKESIYVINGDHGNGTDRMLCKLEWYYVVSCYCTSSLCIFVSVCDVKSESVHLLDGHVHVMLLRSDGLSAHNT